MFCILDVLYPGRSVTERLVIGRFVTGSYVTGRFAILAYKSGGNSGDPADTYIHILYIILKTAEIRRRALTPGTGVDTWVGQWAAYLTPATMVFSGWRFQWQNLPTHSATAEPSVSDQDISALVPFGS